MSFKRYSADADTAPILEHQHGNEEVWTVVAGELEVTVEGAARIAGPGYVAVVLRTPTRSKFLGPAARSS